MHKVDEEYLDKWQEEIVDFLNSVHEEKGDTKIAVNLIEAQPNDIDVEDLIQRITERLREQKLLVGVYSIRYERSSESGTERIALYQLDDSCCNTRELDLYESKVYILVKVDSGIPFKILRVSYDNIETAE